jgi:hypothetical protein
MPDEQYHKNRQMPVLRTDMPDYVFFRIEDKGVSGIPDMNANGNAISSWWEFKKQPGEHIRGMQAFNLRKMAKGGIPSFFVFYDERLEYGPRTVIVEPRFVKAYIANPLDPRSIVAEGINYTFISHAVQAAHRRQWEEFKRDQK